MDQRRCEAAARLTLYAPRGKRSSTPVEFARHKRQHSQYGRSKWTASEKGSTTMPVKARTVDRGRIQQMSPEEVSKLLRSSMKRAKAKDAGGGHEYLPDISVPVSPPRRRVNEERREQRELSGSFERTVLTRETRDPSVTGEEREDPPADSSPSSRTAGPEPANPNERNARFRAPETNPHRTMPPLAPSLTTATASFTVNTEEGKKLMSQAEINQLIRNRILKARQKGVATHSSPKMMTINDIQTNASSRKERASRTATAKAIAEMRWMGDEQARGVPSATSMGEWTEPSQLTEATALVAITERLRLAEATASPRSEKAYAEALSVADMDSYAFDPIEALREAQMTPRGASPETMSPKSMEAEQAASPEEASPRRNRTRDQSPSQSRKARGQPPSQPKA